MKKIILLIIVAFMATNNMQAQLPFDAVRFSMWNTSSSARVAGVGGAFGALGADLTMLSYNPAGLGVYQSSEIMISPSFYSSDAESILLGGDNSSSFENLNAFKLNNLGIVLRRSIDEAHLKSLSFGFSNNLLANYDQSIFYSGTSNGSIVNSFVEKANGNQPSNLDNNVEGLAYDVGAIWDVGQGDSYTSDLTIDDAVDKNQVLERSGYLREYAFSLGANIDNKLMLGITVGLPSVNFRQASIYNESFKNVEGQPLRETELKYKETYKVEGNGVNAKIGAIYKVNKKVRVGLAFHTPTILSVNDSYSYAMNYKYTIVGDVGDNSQIPDPGQLDYKIITPWRTLLNFAYIFGKKGFVGADLEMVNYGGSQFEINENQFDGAKDFIRGVNNEVRSEFDKSVNIKIGGEYTSGIWRLRGGLGLNGAPFVGDNSFSTSYSLGAGVRGRKVYLDLAYVNRQTKEGFTPYQISVTEVRPDVDINTSYDNIVLTFGFKF